MMGSWFGLVWPVRFGFLGSNEGKESRWFACLTFVFDTIFLG